MPRGLGLALKAARRSKELSVSEVSARSGVSRAMIDEIERGKNVSVDTLQKVAKAIGLSEVEIGDVVLRISDAAAAHVRELAHRIGREAEEIVGALLDSEVEESGKLLDFPPRRPLITLAEPEAEDMRAAFANSADAEWRKPFRGRAKHMVPRGIDAAAGHGAELIAPDEEDPKLREIPEHYWEIGARWALRARGNSLILRGIVDRDLLFVKPTPTAENNRIIVCRVNQQAFVKILKRRGETVALCSANPNFGDIEIQPSDNFHCFGIVVGRSGYGLQRTEEVK